MIDQIFGNVWIIEKEVGRAPHPASLADLVEVLTNEHGAEKLIALKQLDSDGRFRWRITLDGQGDYLVVPLPGGTTDE